MAQNFLYMFEFVVEDLLVIRPNHCAPEEYPTCCEVSFRNSVFVAICDREFGNCVDSTAPKCGKCCVFSLDSPINEADRLMIHVYKRKTDKCKFLIGFTEMPIKDMFDKVMDNFNIENPKWEEGLRKHTLNLPRVGVQPKCQEIVDNDCDEETEDRREQLCPTSELKKSLLPLFNLKNCQTGNVVVLCRLVANGPAIVSSFPFASKCNAGSSKKALKCNNNDDRVCEEGKASNVNRREKSTCNGCPPLKDPCTKTEKKQICQRYFACNKDMGYPCDEVEDECDRAPKCQQQKNRLKNCAGNQLPCASSCIHQTESLANNAACSQSNDDCSCEDCMNQCESETNSLSETCNDNSKNPCDQCMQPCFVTPRQAEPGPEAFDEFEACLNGSGLVIRVLKDSHCVESICDGSEQFQDDNSSECCDPQIAKNKNSTFDCDIQQLVKRSSVARNHIRRRTGGHILNHPKLPKIRANIKYSGNDNCLPESYHVPYSKIKNFCNEQENKIEKYRSRRTRNAYAAGDSASLCHSVVHPNDNKNCCVQVDGEDISDTMKGFNGNMRKKGIEVCHKTCDETDTDVFLVKLGSKQKCQHKRNNIEIELKTPKQPIVLQRQRITTETQIDEIELDAALSGICKGKKGKKDKKGKK